jgi:signal transduction histidine kinase/ligand-binding sensor domain-containing protein/DNA-binding response OmpR family regulator
MSANRPREILSILVLFFILFFLSTPPAAALDPGKKISQYSVHIWNMQGGLPGNSVYAVHQTRDGYLWIGTQDGLVRFDGIDFQLYNMKKIPQLKCNDIRALYQDQHGMLWIGTSSGGLTRYKNGQFATYTITAHKYLYGIRTINEDRWGNLWIGSLYGLTCLSSGQFSTYTTKQGLPHNQVKSIHKDGKGDLWVTTAAGIVKLPEPGMFQNYTPAEILPYLITAGLYKEDTKELWIGTFDHGLSQSKNGKFTVYGIEAGITHPTINYLYEDKMKNLWIGTDGGGLVRMKNKEFSTLTVGTGLACGYVYSIYEDREGSLWAGTLDGGLHQLRDGKFTPLTTREGLAHDYIEFIYEDRSGNLWIATKEGLNRLKDGELTTPLTTRQGLATNYVLCLFEDSSGYLWIGTGAGLHQFKNGNLTTLTKKHGLSDNRIKCIVGDRQNNTWIGTENGLNRFNHHNGTFTVFTKKEGLCSNFIEVLFEDSKGNLWIGTDTGLNILKDGAVNVFDPGTMSGNNFVRCAYEDSEGATWFGTDSGLIRRQNNESFLFNTRCGLIEDYVYSILEDENGYLWLGGRNGITRARKTELEDFSRGKTRQIKTDTYNEMDGMKSRWCTGMGCKTRDGLFWFPTSVGVVTIDPRHVKADYPPPPIIIDKVIVDGESIHIDEKEINSKPLELGPGKKRLEFYYTAVSFINPRKIKFKLKLEGYDHDWLEMGTTRITTYTGLAPGNYTFRAVACSPDRIWNREGASFSFYLQPYFYQTTWFYLLVILVLLLAGYSLHFYRVRHMKAREKELGALVALRTNDLKERTIELENAHHKLQHSKELIEAKNSQLIEHAEKLKEMDRVKSRFFANISHEFRTPLTLVMGPLEQMISRGSDSQQEKQLKMALRNSERLLTLINQLLDLSKIDSGKLKLKASRQNIIPFLKGTLAAFSPLAIQRQLQLQFNAPEEDITLYFDMEKMEVVIYNLLANAAKFTPAGGKITVNAGITRAKAKEEKDAPGVLEILVCDTGIGISPGHLPHVFDRFYQAEHTGSTLASRGYERKGTGIGLALTKELLDLHHGNIDVHSTEGKGTEFIIRLPMGTGHLKPEEMVDLSETPFKQKKPNEIANLYTLEDQETPEPGIDTAKEDEIESAENNEPGETDAVGRSIILVVEDNVEVRQYIKGALEPLYKVAEAGNGREGIQLAKDIIPDLIVSDIMMPEIDGYELCKTLKTDIQTSHIPIILLTAKASEESMARGLETGADDYITKPFNTQLLCLRIKNLVDLRRQLQLKIQRQKQLLPAEIPVSSLDEKFLKEFQELIEKNLSDPGFTAEKLSKKLYMGRATLYRKIQALTGEPPRQFIQSYRLERAAQLLKANFGNITEVAYEVGFSSSAHFTKCFKEKFHQLPSTYQAAHGET